MLLWIVAASASELVLVGLSDGERYGAGLGLAHDLDGDGYGDLVVGAPGADDGAGRIDWLLGGVDGLRPGGSVFGEAGEGLGDGLVAPGDLDADGHSDVVAGTGGGPVVYLGGGEGLVAVAALEPGQIQAAGDVDADGHDDLVLVGDGAWWIPGSPGGVGDPVGFEAGNGGRVAGVGDVDGDSYADLATTGLSDFTLLRGSPDGPLPGVAVPIDTSGTMRAGPVGDVDQDGLADAWVWLKLNGFRDQDHRLQLYRGAETGLVPATILGDADCKMSELHVCIEGVVGVGDTRADGVPDLLLLTSWDSPYEATFTLATLYGASDPGWRSTSIAEAPAEDQLGAALAGAEDLDGDGTSDYAMGAPGGESYPAGFVALVYGEPIPAVDADGDGSPAGADCDDENPAVYPGAVETCDGVDQDCDGVVDDGACDTGETGDSGADDTAPDDTGPDDTGPDDTVPHDSGPDDPGPACGCGGGVPGGAGLVAVIAAVLVGVRRSRG